MGLWLCWMTVTVVWAEDEHPGQTESPAAARLDMTVTAEEIRNEPGRQFLPAALVESKVEEHVGETLPVDLVFRNDRAEMVRLRDLFPGDKPAIVSLNYSNCPMLCVLQLNGLINALREVDLIPGQDFRLISVSLDPGEKPEQSAHTKAKYLESYGKAALEDEWHFLSGSESSVKALAQSLGIEYVYLHEKKEYSHPAVFVTCMPDGRISRYHYGIEFPPQTIRLSLVEAGEGKVGSAFDRFLLLCFHYDANAGRFTSTRLVMKMGGMSIILALGALFWFCQRHTPTSQENQNPESPVARTPISSAMNE